MVSSPATDAVIRTMARLAGHRRANLHTVPDEAARLLLAEQAGKLTMSEAYGQVVEAIQSLQESGRIECHWDSQKDWRILTPEGTDEDHANDDAKDAVRKAIRILPREGQRATVHTVPTKAAKLLCAARRGRTSIAEADVLVRKAIEILQSEGRIEYSTDPLKDWRILD